MITKTYEKEIKDNIIKRIKQYTEQEEEVKKFLTTSPNYPTEQQEQDKIYTNIYVDQHLNTFLLELLPYIKNLRFHVKKLTDQNKITAIYLLLGQTYKTLETNLVIIKMGFYYQCMDLIRLTLETSDLVMLFTNIEDENPLLKKWFQGEIVKNKNSRIKFEELINNKNIDIKEEMNIQKAKTSIYHMLSGYSHASYGALLDLFDVYTQDFDFNQNAGFYHIKMTALSYVKSEIIKLLM